MRREETGGTVVPGKYVLTGVTLYGMSGTSTDTDTQTALLCNGIYQSVESTTGTLSDFNGPSFGTISTSGTNTWTESITTCSPSNVPGTPFSFGATYTATATVVSIYVSNVLRTYTLVP